MKSKMIFSALHSEFIEFPDGIENYGYVLEKWNEHVDFLEKHKDTLPKRLPKNKEFPEMRSRISINDGEHDGIDYFDVKIRSGHHGINKYSFEQDLVIGLQEAELLAKYILSVVKQKRNEK